LWTTSIDGERVLPYDLDEAEGIFPVFGVPVEILLDLWIIWCELSKRDQVKALRDRMSDHQLIERHKSD